MNAERILNIPENRPELLFESGKIKSQFNLLAKQWHPDICKDKKAQNVFAHISVLYQKALEKEKNGYWNANGVIKVTDLSGKQYQIKYKYHSEFELGNMYVGHSALVYILKEEFRDLYMNAISFIENLRYANNEMAKEMSRFLPSIIHKGSLLDGYILVIKKTKDVIPLRCFLNYMKGQIPGKHSAWVISSMHNILCYLQWAGIVHNNISLDTMFISPEHHSGLLLGGWWYSTNKKEKIKALPKRTYDLLSPKLKKEKIAEHTIDSVCLRDVGRCILGDCVGTKLLSLGIPKSIINWVMLPHNEDAFKNYKDWTKKVLSEAYGPRKFIKLDVDIEDIYNFKREV